MGFAYALWSLILLVFWLVVYAGLRQRDSRREITLVRTYPDYVARAWNLDHRSGVLILGVPLEKILFGLSVGLVWSGAYEHLKWLRTAAVPRRDQNHAGDAS